MMWKPVSDIHILEGWGVFNRHLFTGIFVG